MINNLGISRPLAVTVAIVAVCVALAAMVYRGIDATTILVFAGVLTTLVGTLKSAEAADTVSKVLPTVEFTASQNAAMQQVLTAHCGEICPLPNCPLRTPVGGA